MKPLQAMISFGSGATLADFASPQPHKSLIGQVWKGLIIKAAVVCNARDLQAITARLVANNSLAHPQAQQIRTKK